MQVLIGTYGAGIWRLDTEKACAAQVAEAQDPSWLLRVGGDRLYATEECLGEKQGRVALFVRKDGAWIRRCTVPSGGENPCHLACSADGKWLAAANYTSGSVALFPLDEAGSPGKPQLFPGHHGGPNAERQEGPHAHFVTFQPEGLLCCDLGADELRRIVLTPDGWQEAAPLWTLPAGTGPRHFARHGNRAYIVCELSGELLTYPYPEGRRLTREHIADGAKGTAAALRFGEDGRLYASHRGGDCVSIYELDASGLPRLALRTSSVGSWPRDVLPIPDGMVCACQKSGEVVLLRRQSPAVRIAVPEPVGLCQE